MLAYALIYANLTGVLGVLALTAVEKLACARYACPGGGGGCYRFLCRGCLLAQTLLMEKVSWCRRTLARSTSSHACRVGYAAGRVFAWVRWFTGRCGTRATGRGSLVKKKQKKSDPELAVEARLRSLKRESPHFSVQHLNSISSLITVDPSGRTDCGRLATLLLRVAWIPVSPENVRCGPSRPIMH